jgi:hypothetical protein
MSIVWQQEFTVPPDDSGGVCGVKFEDSGHAAIMYHSTEDLRDEAQPTPYDPAFFVRLHSWEEEEPLNHTLFRSLMGKRVRVTIEMLE